MRDDDDREIEPQLDAEDRALVTRLRELPPEGSEPDWQALEAAIRAEVGEAAPRPWWRNWRWIVPVWALATTAVIALLVVRGGTQAEQHAAVMPGRDAGVFVEDHAPAPAAANAATAVWLDGEAIEIDDVSGAALDELDGEARAALGPDEDLTGDILPVADYGWIDSLDDEAVARAEDWLKRKRS